MELHAGTVTDCISSEQTRPDEGEGRAGRLRLRLPDGRDVALDRRTLIGSAADNDVVIASDPFVSARHCVVVRDGHRTILRDTSTNGTWLGGARIWQGAGELRPGLPVVLGRTPLRVVAVDEGADGMVGRSEALAALRRWIERAAPTPWPVLLVGESGTGKELAARAVHVRSGRTGRFVPVNCGALSPELVESELFGHERGAFTGAVARKGGVFDEADGGTLFLDEIAELPLSLQPKLLRALESQAVRAVGATIERRVDVRVVAATHQDLRALTRRGAFRLDLYQRLATVEVRLPALRERPEDLPLLARHFLEEIAPVQGSRELSGAALSCLSEQAWPGNIRELKNVLRRAALMSERVIEPAHLATPDASMEAPRAPALAAHESAPPWQPLYPVPWQPPSPAAWQPWAEGRRFDEIERAAIEGALRTHRTGRKAAAALGMAKSTLFDKARRYGIPLRP